MLDPAVAGKVFEQMSTGKPAGSGGPGGTAIRARSHVLRLVAQGLTNKAIGKSLQISDRTVQGHLASIYGKLGVASRTEAVTKALKLGVDCIGEVAWRPAGLAPCRSSINSADYGSSFCFGTSPARRGARRPFAS